MIGIKMAIRLSTRLVAFTKTLSLVFWLLDEKGADVNGTNEDGATARPLFITQSLWTFSLPCRTVARTPLSQTTTLCDPLCGERTMDLPRKLHAYCKTRASEPPLMRSITTAPLLFITPATTATI